MYGVSAERSKDISQNAPVYYLLERLVVDKTGSILGDVELPLLDVLAELPARERQLVSCISLISFLLLLATRVGRTWWRVGCSDWCGSFRPSKALVCGQSYSVLRWRWNVGDRVDILGWSSTGVQ